jgi:hypothetical protein
MRPKLTADDVGRRRAASRPTWPRGADAETAIAALYQAHAAGLIRLAVAAQRPDERQDCAAVGIRGSPAEFVRQQKRRDTNPANAAGRRR